MYQEPFVRRVRENRADDPERVSELSTTVRSVGHAAMAAHASI